MFLERPATVFTHQELTALTDVSSATVREGLATLQSLGVLEVEQESIPQRYRINTGHPAVPGLQALQESLQDAALSQRLKAGAFAEDATLGPETPLLAVVFRYPTNVKILVALAETPERVWMASELAQAADVGLVTAENNLAYLWGIGLLERDVDGRPTTYTVAEGVEWWASFQELLASLEDATEALAVVDE
jgi:DNA-binding transcriptional ArsR family regulator